MGRDCGFSIKSLKFVNIIPKHISQNSVQQTIKWSYFLHKHIDDLLQIRQINLLLPHLTNVIVTFLLNFELEIG